MTDIPKVVLAAIKVNAERDHFTELYEGFNDCPAGTGGVCDCGKAEAEAALAYIEEHGP